MYHNSTVGQVQVQETASYGSSVCAWYLPRDHENRLFGDLDCVSIYIDDILILQKEDEPDEEHIRKI